MTKQITIDVYLAATNIRIEVRDGYDIRETLKARGYRFAPLGSRGMPAWTLTIARTDMDAAKAEAGWINDQRAAGANVITYKED